MKKFLYLSLFLFSFILVGISSVNASELDLSSLGFASCNHNNDITNFCGLDNSGNVYYVTDSQSRVSNYVLVSDSYSLSLIGSSYESKVCYYDKDFVFISCDTISLSDNESVSISSPSDSFYARFKISINRRLFLITDDLNSISSLNYAINSLTETVSNVFTDFTWVFLLAFGIVVIGFIIALILRVGK